MIDEDLMPVVAVRLAEGRSGSTLLMQLLATSPQIVFDEHRRLGVTPFVFGPGTSAVR